MGKIIAKPQLGFMEAVKLACGRLTDFSGRSRRSEFWWFILVFVILSWVFSRVVQAFGVSLLTAEIASDIFSLLALAVLARRLQDTGRSKWWAICAWVLGVIGGIYTATRPAMEELQSVNPDPMAALEIFKDPVTLCLMGVTTIIEIAIFIFCLLDGKPEANQYGESPKYIEVE